MDIKRVLEASYHDALRALAMGTSAAALARARERVFVKALARQLLASCPDESARVFHSYGQDWRAVFGVDGAPGEIRLCRMGSAEPKQRQSQPSEFVAQTVWLAAVDFSRDAPSALRAVNRLNSGAAQNKLLVLARPERGEAALLELLKQPFAGDKSFVAMLPQPATWDEPHDAPTIWQLQADEWRALA